MKTCGVEVSKGHLSAVSDFRRRKPRATSSTATPFLLPYGIKELFVSGEVTRSVDNQHKRFMNGARKPSATELFRLSGKLSQVWPCGAFGKREMIESFVISAVT